MDGTGKLRPEYDQIGRSTKNSSPERRAQAKGAKKKLQARGSRGNKGKVSNLREPRKSNGFVRAKARGIGQKSEGTPPSLIPKGEGARSPGGRGGIVSLGEAN